MLGRSTEPFQSAHDRNLADVRAKYAAQQPTSRAAKVAGVTSVTCTGVPCEQPDAASVIANQDCFACS